ncbi:MAG TPA: hypothetical protein VM163_13790 [bacterium]|nr:hypothetical protein [bacterium]
MNQQRTKAFLERLYGCEPAHLASCDEHSDGDFYARARGAGERVLKRYGRPGNWVPIRVRIAQPIEGDDDPELREFVDGLFSRTVWLQCVGGSEPRGRLLAEGGDRCGAGFRKIVLKTVEPSDVVLALQVSREGPGDVSREPDVELLDEAYCDRHLREGFIKRSLVPSLGRRLGRLGTDRELWDKAVDEAWTAAEGWDVPDRETERKRFLGFLERVEAPLQEGLAVERANRLFPKYRFNARGGRPGLSWRMQRKEMVALRRAAMRYLKARDVNGEE